MKIVIDIPDKTYNDIEPFLNGEKIKGGFNLFYVLELIKKGTPLPEHHGRLIECEPIYDKLIRSYRADKKDYPEIGKDYRVGLSNAIDLLIKAPTIIEGSDNK